MAFRWIGKSEDGRTVTLSRLEDCTPHTPDYFSESWLQSNEDLIRTGTVLDVETTGLSPVDDTIIELGLRQFLFNKDTGEILKWGASYSAFQDPGHPLSSEISSLTGITDDMLAGQKINWEHVHHLFSESAIIIAHNARFDRPFIDKKSTVSSEKIWACSIKQIDWPSKGFFSPKLELLNIYHGFFTQSHRALHDVDALLYLLGFRDEATQKPYLKELINNAKRLMTQVIAAGSPFESKDLLKARGYQWDNNHRFWAKTIYKEDLASEISFLEDSVYFGPFRGLSRDIALVDGFKA